MRWVFAASLAIGFALLVIVLLADLNNRRMRIVVAALVAFGIGGLSAAYAGWPAAAAVLAALVASGVLGWYATVED